MKSDDDYFFVPTTTSWAPTPKGGIFIRRPGFLSIPSYQLAYEI